MYSKNSVVVLFAQNVHVITNNQWKCNPLFLSRAYMCTLSVCGLFLYAGYTLVAPAELSSIASPTNLLLLVRQVLLQSHHDGLGKSGENQSDL